MKFCQNCENILYKDTSNNELKYKCKICLAEIPVDPSDTLMVNVSLKNENSLYKSDIYLNLASKDPICPNVFKKCNNCNETIIKQVVISSENQTIYICPNCNSKFI